MPDTPHLALPLIAAGQAQKHVTHNEALLTLDALLGCAVQDRDLATPPASPADGARYVVADAPTGAWAGKAGHLAVRDGEAWRFHPPRAGLLAYALDEGALLLCDGAAWAPLGAAAFGGALQGLDRLGLGTEADAANPFAAKLNGALWTARRAGEGGTGDLRLALDRESDADTGSLVFQTGYSGRLEIGLLGADGPALKVSPDGATWATAIRIEPTTGVVQGAFLGTFVGAFAPADDGLTPLGGPAARFSVVHATTGTISTSDARDKTDLAPLGEAELAAAAELAGEIGTFRFREAVAEKGEGARRHVGLTVQRAASVLERHGLAPFGYAFICRDGERLGFRTDQLALFLVRGLAARLSREGEVESRGSATG